MTGAGICTTPSKGQTILETKTPSNTCVLKDLKRCSNSSTWGCLFLGTESGRIYQRPFGGQSKILVMVVRAARTCAAADRTGHALLHTLYQANVKAETTFLNEWFAVDMVKIKTASESLV